jgi:hypothetical protein
MLNKLDTILDNTEKNHPKIYASMHTASDGIANTIRFVSRPYTAMRRNYKRNLAESLASNALQEVHECVDCNDAVRRYGTFASKGDFCEEHQKLYYIIHYR